MPIELACLCCLTVTAPACAPAQKILPFIRLLVNFHSNTYVEQTHLPIQFDRKQLKWHTNASRVLACSRALNWERRPSSDDRRMRLNECLAGSGLILRLYRVKCDAMRTIIKYERKRILISFLHINNCIDNFNRCSARILCALSPDVRTKKKKKNALNRARQTHRTCDRWSVVCTLQPPYWNWTWHPDFG